MDILKYDKKNEGGNLQLTLLSSIGKILINQQVETDIIHESMLFYQNLKK